MRFRQARQLEYNRTTERHDRNVSTKRANPLRIFIYATNFTPEVTGSGRYTGEMAKWLAARGHQVTVLTAPPHYPAWQVDSSYLGKCFMRETLDDVHIFRVPLYVPPPEKASPFRRVLMETSFTVTSSVWWVRQLFKLEAPDIVLAICPPTQTILWPWIMKMLRGTPIHFHVQDLQLDAAVGLNMLSSRRLAGLLSTVERLALSAATHISTISQPMRRKISAKGISLSSISILPNWSSVAPERNEDAVRAVRRDFCIGPDQLMVLYSGNLGRKQGLTTLVEAADILRNHPSIKFLIVGRGAEESRLRNYTAQLGIENLSFADLVPEENLASLLTAADIHLIIQEEAASDLVMPSKLTNILAVGRPSIATAHYESELGRLLIDNGAGEIVPPGDPAALAEEILRLAIDLPRRKQMGENAKAYSKANLSIDPIMSNLETTLQQLATRRRSKQR